MILFRGSMKSISNLETNIYTLTDDEGKVIGEMTIVDNSLINTIEDFARTRAIELGDLHPSAERPKNPVSIPILVYMKENK